MNWPDGPRRIALAAVLGLAACGESPADAPAQGLRLAEVLGGTAAEGFQVADRVVPFSFPADHGPHPRFRSEWWYLTVALRSPAGDEFGVQFTLFRQALRAGAPSPQPGSARGDPSHEESPQPGSARGNPSHEKSPQPGSARGNPSHEESPQPGSARGNPSQERALSRGARGQPDAKDDPWRSGQVFLGHLALTDVARDQHLEAERLARGHPRLAGVRAAPFAAWIEGWRLASTGESFLPLRLSAGTDAFAVHLTLDGARPPSPQGDRGLSAKGPDNASYYYSMPRLRAQGTLRTATGTVSVAGHGWLDREWSTSVLADEYAGWDWFALHLDDGRDLMVFQLRRRDGQPDGYDQGLLVDAAGSRHLHADDFDLVPDREWRDRRNVRWPVRWRLEVEGDTLIVDAAVDDQVMDTSVRYWEGLVRVHTPDGRRVGTGYMELTGYR